MKIVKLGGQKNGKAVDCLVGYSKNTLDWEVRDELYSKMAYNQIFTNKEYDTYKLMILSKDHEQKFFYVLNSLNPEEIKSLALEYWNDSETIGYILD